MSAFCKKVQGKVEKDNKFGDVSVEDCEVSKDITYNEVVEYLRYIEKTYADLINGLPKVTLEENVMGILKKFAQVQDSIYARKYKEHDPHLADDLFEICIATQNYELFNNGDYGQNDATRNSLMHDAWTLGKMFIINGNKLERLSNDGGIVFSTPANSTNSVIRDEPTFERCKILNPADKKKAVSFELNKHVYTFQWRRIFNDKQLRPYKNLSFEQRVLDTPPQFTYIATITDNDKKIINDFLGKLNPKASQGGSKKTTSKYTPTQEKVKVGNKTRVVHNGPRKGVKYVKQDGGFVPLSKAK